MSVLPSKYREPARPIMYADVLDKLGEGGYGKVYKCNVGGSVFAIKCVKMNEEGIPYPLEASIMLTYIHPHVNPCVSVTHDTNTFYFIQEVAVSDLSKVSSEDGITLHKWTTQTLEAVHVLHRENIVHCDIKPSNILLFDDGNIKLTDFTHSVMFFGQKYNHQVGTTSYRAPEVLSGSYWDKSVDVWSLGCTFYYFYTQSQLVPHQQRDRANERALESIKEWKHREGEIMIHSPSLTFKCVTLSPLASKIPIKLHLLIRKMLTYIPSLRPEVNECLSGIDHKPKHYAKRRTVVDMTKMGDSEYSFVDKTLRRLDINDSLRKLSFDIYRRVRGHVSAPDLVKIEACSWVACKVATGAVPDTKQYSSNLYQILLTEVKICSVLDFRLHCM